MILPLTKLVIILWGPHTFVLQPSHVTKRSYLDSFYLQTYDRNSKLFAMRCNDSWLAHKDLSIAISVTRWQDYLLNIWQFTAIQICPTTLTISKVGSKFAKYHKPQRNSQKAWNVCQNDEFFQNLVTLIWISKSWTSSQTHLCIL